MGLGLVGPAGFQRGRTLPAVLEARLYFTRRAGAQAGRGIRVGHSLAATGLAAGILGEQGAEQGQRQRQGCRQVPDCGSTVGVPIAGPTRSLQLLEGDGCLLSSRALHVVLHL